MSRACPHRQRRPRPAHAPADVGDPLPFEQPFWAGDHPEDDLDEDPYPLPFHPLELGEQALGTLFGLVYEGPRYLEQVAAFALTERRRGLFGRSRDG